MIPKNLKPIPNYTDYFADEFGEIWSFKQRYSKGNPWKKRTLKKLTKSISGGYFKVGLSQNGKLINKMVSHLVAEAFHGIRPAGRECCHGIKGRLVDTPDNLYWDTRKRNQGVDKYRDKTMQCGERHGQHKLNSLQVRIIKNAYGYYGKNGLPAHVLGNVFGVSAQVVLGIIHGIGWKHIQ